jgi:gluconokinase
MGVTGCGKSTVGRLLAERLAVRFVEGDDLHPAANRRKMESGIPLDDDDRRPWLDAVADRIEEAGRAGTGLVLACSALRESYRERLRRADPGLGFVWLHGTEELLRRRLADRRGHFMPPALLDSQLAALEEPSGALRVEVGPPPAEIVAEILRRLR